VAAPRPWKLSRPRPTPANERHRLAEVEWMKHAERIETTDWEKIEALSLARRRERA
jgi:hypothetical protein